MNFPHEVLIVDDDPVFSSVATSALNALGIGAVHTAADGEEGLDLLKNSKTPIGLIILDLSMPKMDGQTFLGELKLINYSGHVAICSGEPAVSIDIAERLGNWFGVRVVGTLQKPIDMTVLSRMLNRCVADEAPAKGSGMAAPAGV